jgi:hypothetical protein
MHLRIAHLRAHTVDSLLACAQEAETAQEGFVKQRRLHEACQVDARSQVSRLEAKLANQAAEFKASSSELLERLHTAERLAGTLTHLIDLTVQRSITLLLTMVARLLFPESAIIILCYLRKESSGRLMARGSAGECITLLASFPCLPRWNCCFWPKRYNRLRKPHALETLARRTQNKQLFPLASG